MRVPLCQADRLLLALFCALVILLPTSATAHDPAVWIPFRWPANGHNQVYKFSPAFPTGDSENPFGDNNGEFKARVRDGLAKAGENGAQWNELAGNDMNFAEAANVPVPLIGKGRVPKCPSTNGENWVGWRSLDNLSTHDGLGLTRLCIDKDTNEIQHFNIWFDKSVDWYSGVGQPRYDHIGPFCNGVCETDVWSMAAHEWGHAHGWETHMVGGQECPVPDDVNESTMCGESVEYGEIRARSLELHDIHTVEAAY